MHKQRERLTLHTYAALCDYYEANGRLPKGNQAVRALTRCKHAQILLHLGHREACALQRLDIARVVVHYISGANVNNVTAKCRGREYLKNRKAVAK